MKHLDARGVGQDPDAPGGAARRTRGRSRTSRPRWPRGPAFESTPLPTGRARARWRTCCLNRPLNLVSRSPRRPLAAYRTWQLLRFAPDSRRGPVRDRTEPGSRTGLPRPPLRLAPRIPIPLPPAGPLVRSSALPAKRMVRSSARRPKPRRLAKQPLHRWRAGDYCGDHPAATPGPTCRRRMHMTVALADAPNADEVVLIIAREVARRGVWSSAQATSARGRGSIHRARAQWGTVVATPAYVP